MYEEITIAFLTIFLLFVGNMVFMFLVKKPWSELHTWFTFITFLLTFTILLTSIIVISTVEDLSDEDTLIFGSLGVIFPSIPLLVYTVLYIRDWRSNAAPSIPANSSKAPLVIATVTKGGGKRRHAGTSRSGK